MVTPVGNRPIDVSVRAIRGVEAAAPFSARRPFSRALGMTIAAPAIRQPRSEKALGHRPIYLIAGLLVGIMAAEIFSWVRGANHDDC